MKKDPGTKIWWKKRGNNHITEVGKINPDNSKHWKNSNSSGINYNSSTLYLIVKRTFWISK